MDTTFEDAVEIARDAHSGQFDKNGVEYIHHPLAVAGALEPFGLYARIAGVLHDVVEDSCNGLCVTFWTRGFLSVPYVPSKG